MPTCIAHRCGYYPINLIKIMLHAPKTTSSKGCYFKRFIICLTIGRKQITKNIIEINNQQLQLWLRGYDLEIAAPRGIIILKYKDDLVGIGKSNEEKIFNYVPKERKLKTPLPKDTVNFSG